MTKPTKQDIQVAVDKIRASIKSTNQLERLIEQYPCKQLHDKIREVVCLGHDMSPFGEYVETRISAADLILDHTCTDQDTCDCYKKEDSEESQ